MDRKKLSKILAYVTFFVFIINYIAINLYWYFTIWWFDIPMHVLGGFWLGLIFLYFFRPKDTFLALIFKTLLFVFFLGIGWEIFELYFYNYIAQNPLNVLDTSSDVFFDLAGGVFAVFYFLKRIMPSKESEL